MRNYLLVTMGLIIGLSACSPKQPSNEERFAQQALQVVRDSMKDPTSVKLRNVTVIERAKCAYGEALGKNGYGAYAGYQKFVYSDDEVVFDEPGTLTDYTKNPDDALQYIKKQTDCSSRASETLPEHVLHIPQA